MRLLDPSSQGLDPLIDIRIYGRFFGLAREDDVCVCFAESRSEKFLQLGMEIYMHVPISCVAFVDRYSEMILFS